MNFYTVIVLIVIIIGSLLFYLFKKRQGENSKASDVVTIVGLIIALGMGIAPVFFSGLSAWGWHTTILVIGCAVIITRILYNWRK